jgi:hypothetical protein
VREMDGRDAALRRPIDSDARREVADAAARPYQ